MYATKTNVYTKCIYIDASENDMRCTCNSRVNHNLMNITFVATLYIQYQKILVIKSNL